MRRLFFVLLFLLFAVYSFADGCFFWGWDMSTSSGDEVWQKAVVMFAPESFKERIYISSAVSNAGLSNSCWVVPSPSMPVVKVITNDSLLVKLKSRSDPRLVVEKYYSDEGDVPYDYVSCGCGVEEYEAPQPVPSSSSAESESVKVWSVSTNLGFEIIILSASETNIYDWLTNNGYYVPSSAEPVLSKYQNDNWFFSIVRFVSNIYSYSYDTGMFSFEFSVTNSAVFPLYISSIYENTQEVQVMLVSQKPMIPTNYQAVLFPVEELKYDGYDVNSGNWNYSDVVKKVTLTNIKTLAVEYVGKLSSSDWSWSEIEEFASIFDNYPLYLTRYRAFVSSDSMEDVYFVQNNNPSLLPEQFRISVGCEIRIERYYEDEELVRTTTNKVYDYDYSGGGYYFYEARKLKDDIIKGLENGLPIISTVVFVCWVRRKKKKIGLK